MPKQLANRLVKRSHRATCGAFEREVNINPKNMNKNLAALRREGFQIVGTSTTRDKIWFIKRGLAGL